MPLENSEPDAKKDAFEGDQGGLKQRKEGAGVGCVHLSRAPECRDRRPVVGHAKKGIAEQIAPAGHERFIVTALGGDEKREGFLPNPEPPQQIRLRLARTNLPVSSRLDPNMMEQQMPQRKPLRRGEIVVRSRNRKIDGPVLGNCTVRNDDYSGSQHQRLVDIMGDKKDGFPAAPP